MSHSKLVLGEFMALITFLTKAYEFCMELRRRHFSNRLPRVILIFAVCQINNAGVNIGFSLFAPQVCELLKILDGGGSITTIQSRMKQRQLVYFHNMTDGLGGVGESYFLFRLLSCNFRYTTKKREDGGKNFFHNK